LIDLAVQLLAHQVFEQLLAHGNANRKAQRHEEGSQEANLEALLDQNCQDFGIGPCNDANQDGGGGRDKGNNIRDLTTAFMLCNEVSPLYKDKLGTAPQTDKYKTNMDKSKQLGDPKQNRGLQLAHQVVHLMNESLTKAERRGARKSFQPDTASLEMLFNLNHDPEKYGVT